MHLRKSNTEPIIRIYTEAKTQSSADQLALRIMNEMKAIDLIQKAQAEHNLTASEIMTILVDDCCNDYLFQAADEVRSQYVGEGVHLRALIELSNVCSKDCYYCGLRCSNNNLERYRLSPDEVMAAVVEAKSEGYQTIVLQSGEADNFANAEMVKIISEIKAMGLAITLSLGEKTYGQYKAYKDAGADRYLLRIETTNEAIYRELHPGMDFHNRVKCLEALRTLGYEVGTGCLVGLPQQTLADLAQDILFFKEINADMVGLGPFISNPDTPLREQPSGQFLLSIKVMAVVRLLLPDINIPATTAMESLHQDGRKIALQAGANVIMPNVTTINYRQKYLLYPGKIGLQVSTKQNRQKVVEIINSINRFVADNKGFRGNK